MADQTPRPPVRRRVVRVVTTVEKRQSRPPAAPQPTPTPRPQHRPSVRPGGPSIGVVGVVIAVIVAVVMFGTHSSPAQSQGSGSGSGSGSLPAVSVTGMLSCSPEPASLVGPGAPGADQRAADCKAAKTYADQLVTAKYGKQLPTKPFSQGDNAPSEQLSCLDHLWTGESEWDDWAKNPGSWAYGIPQYDLPTGHPYNYGDWKAQIDWGTKYIWGSSSSTGRYGTPCNAYGFWLNQSPHWY